MLTLKQHDGKIDCTLSSDPKRVELLSHLLADIFAYEHEVDATRLVLVARELLADAVRRCEAADGSRTVCAHIERLDGLRFMVRVRAAGCESGGRDTEAAGLGNPRRVEPGGYEIAGSVFERLERADNGATVTVYLVLEKCAASRPSTPAPGRTRTPGVGREERP
jgi:hypothetical protein